MQWQQLQIFCTAEQAPLLEVLLTAHGALSITIADAADQPIFEPSPDTAVIWQASRLTALFSDTENLTAIEAQLRKQALRYHREAIADEAWERKWMDDFHPLRFGQRTWIVPSWHVAPDPQAVNIVLDPGLAFGTGTHPTTALCLSWLDEHEIQDKTVIDYGCGSGILAIAALKHGASEVIAVDHDEQALQATRANAERNALGDSRLAVYMPTKMPEATADILIANILAQPLLALRERFWELLNTKGRLVLSGILASQKQLLVEAYGIHFSFIRVQQQDEWLLLEFVKSA